MRPRLALRAACPSRAAAASGTPPGCRSTRSPSRCRERLDGPVGRLLGDRVVEIRGGSFGSGCFATFIRGRRRGSAFPRSTACRGSCARAIARVEAHRDLELAAALFEPPSRSGRGRGPAGAADPPGRARSPFEGRRGVGDLDLGQVREAEDRLGPRQIRLERGGLSRRREGRVELAQGRADLGEPAHASALPGSSSTAFSRLAAPPPGRTSPVAHTTARPARGRLRVGGDCLLGGGKRLVRTVARDAAIVFKASASASLGSP